MSFSLPKYQSLGTGAAVGKILKRTAIIFLLGFLMYWFPFVREIRGGGYEFAPLSNTRVFGVLQRIALCYGIASLMIYFLPKKAVWVVSGVFLIGYWIMLYFGGDYSMLGNVGDVIDKVILGEPHMYHGEGIAFEPEGILSTLPSVVNVVFGIM